MKSTNGYRTIIQAFSFGCREAQNYVLNTIAITFVFVQVFQEVDAKMRLGPKRFTGKRPERGPVRKLEEEVGRASGCVEERGGGRRVDTKSQRAVHF